MFSKSVRGPLTPAPLVYGLYARENVDNCERPFTNLLIFCNILKNHYFLTLVQMSYDNALFLPLIKVGLGVPFSVLP